MSTKIDRVTGYDALGVIAWAVVVTYARAYVVSVMDHSAWWYWTTYWFTGIAMVLTWVMAVLGMVLFVVDYKKKG